MDKEKSFQEAMRSVRVLKLPRRTLATFGTTTMPYVLISPLAESQGSSRLREGSVTAARPAILTPDLWRQRFEGFGDEAQAFQDDVARHYGESFRALEYHFKNQLASTTIESSSLSELAARITDDMGRDEPSGAALLQAPDSFWGLAVMKYAVEFSLKSFPINVRELEERGLFDPSHGADTARRRRVEQLFARAQKDRSILPELGAFLKDQGLFTEYEDRFFALVQR